MKDIAKLVLVLGLICTVAGLALAGVHSATKEPIEIGLLKNVQGPAISAVLKDYMDEGFDPISQKIKLEAGLDKKGRKAYKTIFPGKKGGKLEAVAVDGSGKGFEGQIGVMVGITPEGKLTGIAIMKQSETPGIGSRVTEPSFTNQFKAVTVDNPTAVDGVSGASYSTRGVFAAVEEAVKFYKENQKEILAQVGQK